MTLFSQSRLAISSTSAISAFIAMNTAKTSRSLFVIGLVLACAFANTGCQVYRSQGRKNFESDTDGRLQKTSFGNGSSLTQNCWVQDSQEPLPDYTKTTDYKWVITDIEATTLVQVCPQETISLNE